jgi:GNAT superfamily N-acetyltransferase
MQVQVEAWKDALPELLNLFPLLWEDVAVDKDKFRAQCDQSKYAALDQMGILHLVTAREAKRLVGYFLVFVQENAHYKGQGLMAFTDMYFLLPDYRGGGNGLKLFSFMEKTLREKGVVKIYSSHKNHREHEQMFKFLGYQPTDTIYSKCLQ